MRRVMGCGATKGTKVLPVEGSMMRKRNDSTRASDSRENSSPTPTPEAGPSTSSPRRTSVVSRRLSRRRSRAQCGIVDQETQVELAELRATLQATQTELERLQGWIDPADPAYLIVKRDSPADEVRDVLTAEIVKLQPYGPTESETNATGTNQTIAAQEVMIKRLEADLETYKDETRKMREGYERKVRRVRVTSAKFRAESEVKLGELKEELASQSKVITAVGPVDDGPHTDLIVSLSQQLASCHEELAAANLELSQLRSDDSP
eukprot:m.103414 g.103414  ORF g.103414 m.103414 type:complete len:264 (-) comp20878_c0_seq1:98-889(-)